MVLREEFLSIKNSYVVNLISMRLPTRKSQLAKQQLSKDDGPAYLTQTGLDRLVQTIKDLEENQLPQAIEDTRTTAEHGDFSENAEYQEAKHRMRRIHARLFYLKERLKRVRVIEKDESDKIQLGSTVILESEGKQKTYEIVGPHETNPMHGRISHVSPLGRKLIGKSMGDRVILSVKDKEVEYCIREVN